MNTSNVTLVSNEKSSEKDYKNLIITDAVSVISATTVGVSDLGFDPSKSLYIQTGRVADVPLLTAPSKLQVDIFNADGTIAYQSIRARRSSGSCTLTNGGDHELIATEYFFGPRDPIIHLLGNEAMDIKTTSKLFSRSHIFALPDGRKCNWEYKKVPDLGGQGKNSTAVILSVDGQAVAALIRNEKPRTLGIIKSCNAGDGGELILSDSIDEKSGISEEIVVASCLLMLKKEADCRRMVDCSVPSNVAG
ncbi:hypothetical protein B0J11DRAFT_542355 [Dendryphion nanum]|uniref:Uncharacterized protein n=1 Tax=Dendryphion nanum TaxID=256645 RepID=A0A9P9D5A9_9PLEO|nr:hypothetical protein B0J11DRAFT_542355 [Dendryphion nanum]